MIDKPTPALSEDDIEMIRVCLDDGTYTRQERKDFAILCDLALQALRARPAGEPVAWLIETNDDEAGLVRTVSLHNSVGDYRDQYPKATATPLYASPPSARPGWQEAIEAAAKVCEQIADEKYGDDQIRTATVLRSTAKAIRSITPPSADEGGEQNAALQAADDAIPAEGVESAEVKSISETSIPLMEAITQPCKGCGKRPIDFITGDAPAATDQREEERNAIIDECIAEFDAEHHAWAIERLEALRQGASR